MIVRDLLIKLGFKADTADLTKTDRQVTSLKASTLALSQVMAQFATQGLSKAAQYMQESAEASIEFGRSMAGVSAIMDGGQADVAKMAEAAQSLGKEFGIMPKEVSEAMYDVVGNLGYTKDTIDQVRQSILLAKSGASSTSEAFGLLSAVTRAYGDTSAEAMDKVANLSSMTVRLGALTLPQLAGSIQSVTPIAKTLGVSLEELFAAQASLSGVTGSAAEVYTQMEGALGALLKKTPAMEKAWKKIFGKQTVEQAIGKDGVQGVLQKLVNFTHGNKDMVADLFGRKEALQYVFALTGNLADDYRSKLGQLKNASGEVHAAIAKQTTGMGANAFALDKAKAAAEAQRIELGEKLAPAYVHLQIAAGQVAELFGNKIMPLFTDTGNTMEGVNSNATVMEGVFKALQFVVAGVSESLDFVITQIRLVVIGIMQAAKAAVALKNRDWAGAKAAMAEGVEMEKAAGAAFLSRTADRARIVAGYDTASQTAAKATKASAAAEERRAQLGNIGSAIGNFLSSHVNVGGVTVNVAVPAGTEAQSAARIADQGSKVMLQQFLAGVQQAFPVGADAGSAW